jgi:hypothetical protein
MDKFVRKSCADLPSRDWLVDTRNDAEWPLLGEAAILELIPGAVMESTFE